VTQKPGGTFGIVLCRHYNPVSLEGIPFDTGTSVIVEEVERLADGRYNILVSGDRRFIIREKNTQMAYLQGHVSWLSETDDIGFLTEEMLTETRQLFLEAIRLAQKIMRKAFTPPELPADPTSLSYFIAEHLRGSLALKQELLEISTTEARLAREREILQEVVRPLAAQAQIEDVFQRPR
jgi:Lon protease-like protein